MKKLLFVLSVILLCGCNFKTTVEPKETSFHYGNGMILNSYIIDSCEYLGTMSGGGNDILTHKGNCKNPIHKNK